MHKILTLIPAAVLLSSCTMEAEQDCSSEDIIIADGWARATAEGSPMGAAYFSLSNTGDCTAVLLSASTDIAGVASLHETRNTGTMSSMEAIERLDIAAGETVAFEPGGKHVMLGRLEKQLVAGESFTLTLTFEGINTIETEIAIVEPGSR